MKTSATMRQAADLLWKLRAGDNSTGVLDQQEARFLVDYLHAGAAKLEKAAKAYAGRPSAEMLLREIGELES